MDERNCDASMTVDAPMTIGELEKKMTQRQILFCKHYATCGNGKDAAVAAGYSEKSAVTQASKLLADPKIQEYRRLLSRELFNQLGLSAQSLMLDLEEVKRRCMTAKPHMVWDSNVKEWVPDGLWIFDAKGAVSAIKAQASLMGESADSQDVTVRVQSLEDYIETREEGRVL